MPSERITLERQIRARPETVFSFFIEADLYARWMGVEAVLDARPGGIYQVHTPQGLVARGEFVEVDPPHRVVFTWGWEGHAAVPPGSTRVEITLTADDGHTTVTLVHSGLPVGEMEVHTMGWDRYLGRLVTAAEGGDPGPDEA